MLRKLLLMLGEENNLIKSGLTYVFTAVSWYLCVPGDGLKPFRRVIICGGLPPLTRKTTRQKYNSR